MEILQFLLSFLLEEYGGENFKPLLDCMKENNYDIKETLKNISPDKLAPIVRSFMEQTTKRRSDESERLKLSPIENFADEEILSVMNGYFENFA